MFAEFPVSEIVKTVVKDPVKTETALKAIGKVKYDLKYTASVNTASNVVELTLAPKTLELQIPVDGAIKKTIVTLAAKEKGFYVGMDRSLRFALKAEKITVDGTALTPYEVIDYNFPFCIKINNRSCHKMDCVLKDAIYFCPIVLIPVETAT